MLQFASWFNMMKVWYIAQVIYTSQLKRVVLLLC